jgi:hypothetical protein
LAQASSGKNITPVCTNFSVFMSIEQSRSSPEFKKSLEINIQDQGHSHPELKPNFPFLNRYIFPDMRIMPLGSGGAILDL